VGLVRIITTLFLETCDVRSCSISSFPVAFYGSYCKPLAQGGYVASIDVGPSGGDDGDGDSSDDVSVVEESGVQISAVLDDDDSGPDDSDTGPVNELDDDIGFVDHMLGPLLTGYVFCES